MAIVGLQSGYSNVVAGTVQSTASVLPPVIRVTQFQQGLNDLFLISWNDMNSKAIAVDAASDAKFASIVARASGLGNMVNGKQGLAIKLPKGQYWFRAVWQSANIQTKGVSA